MSSSSATGDYVYRFAPTEISSRPRSKLYMLMKGDSGTRTLSDSYDRTVSRSQTPSGNSLKARTTADAVECERSYRELASYLQSTVAYTKPSSHRKFVTASKKITARFFRVGARCKLKWSQQRVNRKSFDPYRPNGVVHKLSTNGSPYYEILPHHHLGTYLHTQKLRRDDSNRVKQITASEFVVNVEDLGDPLAGLEFPIPTTSFGRESGAQRLQLEDVITCREMPNDPGPHSNFSRPKPSGRQPPLKPIDGTHGTKRIHREAALESLENSPSSRVHITTGNACRQVRLDCSTPEPAGTARHSRESTGSSSSQARSSPSRIAVNTGPAPSGPLPPLPLKSALRQSRPYMTASPARPASPTLGYPVSALRNEVLSPEEVESLPQRAEQDLFDALHDAESVRHTEVKSVSLTDQAANPDLNVKTGKSHNANKQPEEVTMPSDEQKEQILMAIPAIHQPSVTATDFAYIDTKLSAQDSTLSLHDLNFPNPPNRKRTSSESSKMRHQTRSALPRLTATTAAANLALNQILSDDESDQRASDYSLHSSKESQTSARAMSSRSHTPRSSGTSYASSSTLSSIHESDERCEILERENKMLQAALMAVLRTNGRLNSCPCGRGEDVRSSSAASNLRESCYDCDETSPTSPLELYKLTKKMPEAGPLVRTLPLMTLSM